MNICKQNTTHKQRFNMVPKQLTFTMEDADRETIFFLYNNIFKCLNSNESFLKTGCL